MTDWCENPTHSPEVNEKLRALNRMLQAESGTGRTYTLILVPGKDQGECIHVSKDGKPIMVLFEMVRVIGEATNF